MTVRHFVGAIGVPACLVVASAASPLAERSTRGGPVTDTPVVGVPFSATATTTVRQTLRDGTRVERTGTARYYRDRAGRVRVEQSVGGHASGAASDRAVRITIGPDPSAGVMLALDPVARTANQHPRAINAAAIGGGDTYAVPLGGPRWRFLVFSRGERLRGLGAEGHEDSLGVRRVEGIDVIGRRLTMTIPPGAFGNDRPYDIVDERWESPELMLLMYARSEDPRAGVIDYRLTDLRRIEPPAELFVVPPDYVMTIGGDNGVISLEFAERQGVRSRTREP
jgi:hypothetical protein